MPGNQVCMCLCFWGVYVMTKLGLCLSSRYGMFTKVGPFPVTGSTQCENMLIKAAALKQ